MWSRFNIRFCAANLQCARCMTSRNGITYIDTAKCWYCDILGYFFLSCLKFFPYFFNWVICFWNLFCSIHWRDNQSHQCIFGQLSIVLTYLIPLCLISTTHGRTRALYVQLQQTCCHTVIQNIVALSRKTLWVNTFYITCTNIKSAWFVAPLS